MSVEPETGKRLEHPSGISRRTMLKAGWSVPVIMTVAPSVAFAASGLAPSPPTSTTINKTTVNNASTPSPSGARTPTKTTPSPTTPKSPQVGSTPSVSPAGASEGIPQQQSQGPRPARINRGFAG